MPAMTTFAVKPASWHRCDSCGTKHRGDTLEPIMELLQRIEPGGIVPSGECSECGALCYPLVEVSKPRKHKRERKPVGCETCSEWCRPAAVIQTCYACGLPSCVFCSRILLDHGYSHRYIRVCVHCLEVWPKRFGLEEGDVDVVHFLFQFIPDKPTDLRAFRGKLLEIGRKNGCAQES